MRFGILGPLQVQGTTGSVPLIGPKRRILLLALLAHANEPVSVDQLIDWLWPDRPPYSAVATIQAHVSTLRRDLEPDRLRWTPPRLLLTRPTGYLIRVGADHLDSLNFEELVATGTQALQQGRAELTSVRLREALALWRGAPLAEAALAEAAQGEIARLEELRLTATMLRVEAELTLGRYLELVPELSRLVVTYPLHERFYGQLMIALAAVGRRADALAVYRRAREALARELGVKPGPALRRIEAKILAEGDFDDVYTVCATG
jgi:DNA-binding SARP family transcriptional activator